MAEYATSARGHAVGIVRALRDAGHEAYLAGGCVRDELLGLSPKDFDVATDATPDKVAALFPRTREVGRAFGVMLVTDDRIVTEVATFRTEGAYSDKRRPDEVEYSTAQEDAKRRDFTVNALFIDPLDASEREGGRVIDFVGGIEDLSKKIIRAVGDPDERLAEDDLRSLRAVRFTARLGFEIEQGTRDAITRHAGELVGISRERVGDELRAMLAHPARARAVALIRELGLEAAVLLLPAVDGVSGGFLDSCDASAPPTVALGAWCADRAVAMEGGSAEGVPGRLSADEAEIARSLRGALVLSNDETDHLRGVLRGFGVLVNDFQGMRVAHQKRAAVEPWFGDVLGLMASYWADMASSLEAQIRALESDGVGIAPDPVLTGDDLIASGLKPGPEFKGWLDEAYNLQLEGVLVDRSSALAIVEQWARVGMNKD